MLAQLFDQNIAFDERKVYILDAVTEAMNSGRLE